MSKQDKAAPVEHTICLNPIHKETICSQNQDFYTHKPVAWMISDNCGTHFIEDKRDWYDAAGVESITPLYTHPKQWVGLTEEEQRAIFFEIESGDFGSVVSIIEAKLKEKNT